MRLARVKWRSSAVRLGALQRADLETGEKLGAREVRPVAEFWCLNDAANLGAKLDNNCCIVDADAVLFPSA